MKILIPLILMLSVYVNTPTIIGSTEEAGVMNGSSDPINVIQVNWIYYADEPIRYFRSARESFQEGVYPDAAHALRQAMAYLVLESIRFEEKDIDLDIAIAKLDQLVEGLESGRIISEHDYHLVLAQVNRSIASHYQKQAEMSWEKDRPKRTGRALQTAINHFERAAKVSDYQFDETQKSNLDDSKRLSEQLTAGKVKAGKEDVNKNIKSFGDLIKSFEIKSNEELRIERKF